MAENVVATCVQDNPHLIQAWTEYCAIAFANRNGNVIVVPAVANGVAFMFDCVDGVPQLVLVVVAHDTVLDVVVGHSPIPGHLNKAFRLPIAVDFGMTPWLSMVAIVPLP